MLTYAYPSDRIADNNQVKGIVSWSSPSNIALIKYWGKHGRQLPQNASISFTLSNAKTTTKISYKSKTNPSDNIDLTLIFEGERNKKFEEKMISFFESILNEMPFLNQLVFTIESSNSFPHSAGIASSASAMSSIACCLCDIENKLFKNNAPIDRLRASYIARLGSGSASRSVFSTIAVWGITENVYMDGVLFGANDLCALGFDHGIDDVFKTYHDDIMIVSKKEKSVSSTAGHQLMKKNVYAKARYKQAEVRMQDILIALKEGDQAKFGKIVEDEALTLHALMMSSDPSYLLMHPNTLHVIEKVRAYREKSGVHLYFTLDAGPNVHLLYPDSESKQINSFIGNELLQYCEDGLTIKDYIGEGPKKLL